MRIIVNNTAASLGGALSILNSFYEYLIDSEAGKNHEWIFLLSENYIKETDNIKVITLNEAKKNWMGRLKFDILSGKKIIRDLEPDVVFSLQNTIIYGVQSPQVLYMHQSLPFQKEKKFSFFDKHERKLAVYQHGIGKLIKKSVRKADFVIVQTKWIKEEVINSTGVSKNKVFSILPPFTDVTKYKKEQVFDRKSFFYPANANIYKNHKCIYDASRLLNQKGIEDYKISLTIKKEFSLNNIEYLGNLPFSKVMERYNNSTLIFPSYIETVGLPLIEAKEMGTIILAADCKYAREILNGYENAYFFDPRSPEQLSLLLEKVIKGDIRKKNVKAKTCKRENTWNQVVDILIKQGSEND